MFKNLIRELALEHLLDRELYQGFSGGEAKKFESFITLIQKAKLYMFDEPDSGIDIDSVKRIAKFVSELLNRNAAILLVTYIGQIIRYLDRIDRIYVMINGSIVRQGKEEVLDFILKKSTKLFLNQNFE